MGIEGVPMRVQCSNNKTKVHLGHDRRVSPSLGVGRWAGRSKSQAMPLSAALCWCELSDIEAQTAALV